MSWILNWYESKTPAGSIPDVEEDKGELIKRSIGWFGLFDIDTVKLCKTDRVIMEGYLVHLPPVPIPYEFTATEAVIDVAFFVLWGIMPGIVRIGSNDGVRLHMKPFTIVDEWKIRDYEEKQITIWPPKNKMPLWKIEYFNAGGPGRVRFGLWWLKKEEKEKREFRETQYRLQK